MTPLDHIPGLRRLASRPADGRESHAYAFEPDADAPTARAVVAGIRERWSLQFFDGAHPTISDPGAYVTYYRRDGELRAHCANHGWSSGWTDVADEAAAAYLSLCIEHNRGSGFERLRLTTSDRRDWPGDGRSASGFRTYLAQRLKAVDQASHPNGS